MPDTPDLERFTQYALLANDLMADASKEDIIEVASILAMNLAQYKAKYGELPDSEYLSLAKADEITPELARTLAGGMDIGWGAWDSGNAEWGRPGDSLTPNGRPSGVPEPLPLLPLRGMAYQGPCAYPH